jgi:cytochrome c oxidase assembly protein subunit 15
VEGLSWQARALALTLLVQFLTGLSNVVLQWPLALAVAHNGGAAVLVALLVAMNVRLAQAGEAVKARRLVEEAFEPPRTLRRASS